ncbi:D-aminoacyl-tRNA deacylase [Arhodomonas sp. SL1]|uniref:D-aminoacyl-tRNA deacylase n=1 Tax=Arhodomonas sp. SL1 TaxID=3425691 RepID=UPI003F884C7A
MIALLQRVRHAEVRVDGETVAAIGAGLLVLAGVQRDDEVADARRLAERLLAYRVFPDAEGRMNRSLTEIDGGLLLVPQFTLAADTRKGNRPGFSTAAPPERGEVLFRELVACCRQRHADVQAGVFGADMAVGLTNDGPVTFWLQTR